MKKLIIAFLISPAIYAHPGHEHLGILAHGIANSDLLMMLFALFVVSCAWSLGFLERASQ